MTFAPLAEDREADRQTEEKHDHEGNCDRGLRAPTAALELLRFKAAPALFDEMLFPPIHCVERWSEFSVDAR